MTRVGAGQHRVVLDLQACQTEGSRGRGIGRYSRSLAETLVRTGDDFDFVVGVNEAFADSAEAIARAFEPAVGPGHVFRYPATIPNGSWSATRLDVGRLSAEWIAQFAWLAQKPDLIHVSSVFEGINGISAVPSCAGLPAGTVLSATVYDLIPLLFADIYLPSAAMREAYQSRIERLRRSDILLAISEATRRDVIERLGYPAERVANVLGAADECFVPAAVSPHRRAELLRAHGLARPYVMYTGGIDHRKNVEALIRAYALMPPALRRGHQLVIVCTIQQVDRIRLLRLATKSGLAPDVVVLTGFVSDDDLVDLYRCCHLFVFPSQYEGFGLPVLEAMSCGAPTLAAATSSLPEIVGWNDALFAVDSDEQIGRALTHALSDADFRERLRAHGLRQSALFSWRGTAARAQDAWREAIARNTERMAVALRVSRPRLAVVSPLLPERSGIADYVTELLPHLAKQYEIDLFAAESADAERYRGLGFAVRNWQELPGCWQDYDAGVLYQFGNSEFHVHMLALLGACPGAVLLHDAFLSGLMAYTEHGPPRVAGLFTRMLRYAHSGDALADYEARGLDHAIDRYPMSRWVADHATGVIVTSRHARDLLVAHGQIDGARSAIVPHHRAVRVVTDMEREAARDALGVGSDTVLVCSFGHTHPRKLSAELVRAWAVLALPARSARLVIVGEASGEYGDALRNAIGDGASIAITGYVTDDDFHRYMRAADVVVQLREGSRGEASGAALYAMAYGRPLVASAHGSLAEIPDAACVHVDDPFDSGQLVRALRQLVEQADERGAVGRRGQEWIREQCDPGMLSRALAIAVTRFNDAAIVHRSARLRMRLESLPSNLGSEREEWIEAMQQRAAMAEPARLNTALAQSITQSLGRLLPACDFDAAMRTTPTREYTDLIAILADDPRLATACGIKAHGTIRTNGAPGVLLYGPHVEIDPGRYRVRAYGTCTIATDHATAVLEVVVDGGRQRLAHVALSRPHSGAAIDGVLGRLDFTLRERVTDLEVRALVSGGIDMAIESLDIVRIAPGNAAY